MTERFSSTTGSHCTPAYLTGMTDKELEAAINGSDGWDADLLRELCWRARMIDEWDAAGEDFETVACAAADKLGLDI